MWVANLRSSMRGRQQQLAQPRKMAWQPRSSDFGTTFQDRNGDKGTVGHSSSQKVTTSRKMTGAANVSSAACLSLQCSAAAAKMTPPPHYCEMPARLAAYCGSTSGAKTFIDTEKSRSSVIQFQPCFTPPWCFQGAAAAPPLLLCTFIYSK